MIQAAPVGGMIVAGGSLLVTSTCPGNEQIINVGWFGSGSFQAGVRLINSLPQGSTWLSLFYNASNVTESVTTYPICLG